MRLFKAASNRRKSAVSISSLEPTTYLKVPVPIALSVRSEMSDSRDSVTSLSAISSGPRSTSSESRTRLVRRPNLSQILADQASPPWTLEAFIAYAERNMCLENIEFIQDAERYRAAYAAAADDDNNKYTRSDRDIDDGSPPLRRMDSAQTETLKEMWTRIMLLYVAPSSPKELNLPSSIRSALIPHNKSSTPASPHLLDPAVQKIMELIEDSILFSFLNEVNASYQPSMSSRDDLALDNTDKLAVNTHEADRQKPSVVHSTSKSSPKLGSFGFAKSRPHASGSSKTALTGRPNSITPISTDESGSVVASPTSTNDLASPEPKTPPLGSDSASSRLSPKLRKDNGGAGWKRMSARFGFARKAGTHLKDVMEDQQQTAINEHQ